MSERALRRAAFVGFALSGAAALMYEVVWTRNLSLIMGSSTYALSTMLAAFMAGLAAGGWFGARILKKVQNHLTAFALCEFGIGLSGILIIPIIKSLMPLYMASFYSLRLSFNLFSAIQFLIIFLIIGIPTTLMGMTFPLVVSFVTKGRSNEALDIGRLYSVNTLGAITGAMCAGFLLMPLAGMRNAALTAAIVNLLTASVLLIFAGKFRQVFVAALIALTVLTVEPILEKPWIPFFSYYSGSRFQSYDLAKRVYDYIQRSGKDRVLFHYEGLNGDVYLARVDDGVDNYALINNGKLEGGDHTGFALLADIPFFTHSEPHQSLKALSIGLGSGYTLSEIASYPFSHIDSVELSRGILEANRRFLSPALFRDPRINHIEADGRNYLLVSKHKYDVIVASPSWAVEQASAGLLTDEFLSLAASRLHDSGVFAIWVDYFLMDDEDLFMLLRTMAKNFRHVTAWHVKEDNIIMAGSNFDDITPSSEVTSQILANRPHLKGMFELAFSDKAVRSLVPGNINTDERPVIEFHNAKHIIAGHKRHYAVKPLGSSPQN